MPKQQNNEPQKKDLKNISPESKKNFILLLANTVILTFIYFGSMGLDIPFLSIVVTFGYWIAFAGFLIAYIAYNRAFTRKNLTPEMLPDSWPKKKKDEYIAQGKIRFEKSRWMISVIIPIMIPIMLDAIYLFTFEMIKKLF